MIDFARMLPFEDHRWAELKGGYRVPFDPRPSLMRIESGTEVAPAWHELWEELHHQGDVGEASYAAVPHLVRMGRECAGAVDREWNLYGLVACIELARRRGSNPQLPDWCTASYFAAIEDLAQLALSNLGHTTGEESVRAMLSVVALSRSLPVHAEFLLDYSEDEMTYFADRINQLD